MAADLLLFQPSKAFTIGVEWELQLLDADHLDLAPRALPVLELFPDNPWIKPELIQSCVEINSKVCDDIVQLKDHLGDLLANLHRRCESLGLKLCGAGTHPFCRRLALITPLPRYLREKADYGYMARSQITYAMHVHLGMPDAEVALTLMREIKAYLPVLIALSANSPFWRGYETGFACYRQRILASGRSYGIPPAFSTWDQFCQFFEVTRRAGVFQQIREIHWDLRPRPRLGTLEVRVLDSQPCLKDVVAVAVFVRCLARYLVNTQVEQRPAILPTPIPWWLEKENYFQATRRGSLASYIDADGGVRPLSDIIEVLFDLLLKRVEKNHQNYLHYLHRRFRNGLGWQRQLHAYHESRQLPSVVRHLIQELQA